jgi:hypothetical protein
MPAGMSKGYVRGRFPIMPAQAAKPQQNTSQAHIDRRILPASALNSNPHNFPGKSPGETETKYRSHNRTPRDPANPRSNPNLMLHCSIIIETLLLFSIFLLLNPGFTHPRRGNGFARNRLENRLGKRRVPDVTAARRVARPCLPA